MLWGFVTLPNNPLVVATLLLNAGTEAVSKIRQLGRWKRTKPTGSKPAPVKRCVVWAPGMDRARALSGAVRSGEFVELWCHLLLACNSMAGLTPHDFALVRFFSLSPIII